MGRKKLELGGIGFSLPGIDSELVSELESTLLSSYDLPLNWSIITTGTIVLAQIVYNSKRNLKHQEYTSSESISRLVKKVLANSYPARVVYAASAIRRTMGVYSVDRARMFLSDTINGDFEDLVENPTGAASTKGGERAAFTSIERTRKYRRGLMLQAAGSVCNRTLTRPQTVISRTDSDRVTLELILEASPFSAGVPRDTLISRMKELLGYQVDDKVVDNFEIDSDNNLTSIENELELPFSRESLKISPKEIAVDFDSLDDLQKIVFKAKKRLI